MTRSGSDVIRWSGVLWWPARGRAIEGSQKLEQLASEFSRPRRGPLDLLDVLVQLAFGQLLGEEVRVVEDHREQIVEVVRDPAGEPPRALRLDACGDIAYCGRHEEAVAR